MQVKAITTAFYRGARVRPGVILDVPADLKGSWFVKLEDAPKAAKPAKQEPKALSELVKDESKSFTDAMESKK